MWIEMMEIDYLGVVVAKWGGGQVLGDILYSSLLPFRHFVLGETPNSLLLSSEVFRISCTVVRRTTRPHRLHLPSTPYQLVSPKYICGDYENTLEKPCEEDKKKREGCQTGSEDSQT